MESYVSYTMSIEDKMSELDLSESKASVISQNGPYNVAITEHLDTEIDAELESFRSCTSDLLSKVNSMEKIRIVSAYID